MTLPRPGLLALGALVALVVCVAADPCTLPTTFGNAFVGDPKKLLDCFTQVPFQKEQAQDTIKALKSLRELYSFTDISANSGAPYDLKSDLYQLIDAMESKVNNNQYSNDYAFQTDVMNAFNPLFDAHTLYRAPAGYNCFLIRPFNIEAAVGPSGNDMVYTLRPGPFDATTVTMWKQIFKVDISSLNNQVVTKINGVSPTEHVMKVAQNFISTYKDQGVRYNAALRGRWAQTILSMFPVTDPNMDFQMTLTLANGQVVTVPNAGFCGGGGISSTSGLLGKNRGSASAALAVLETMTPEQVYEQAKSQRILLQGLDIYREQRELFNSAVRSSNIVIKPSAPLRRDSAGFQPGHSIDAHDYRYAKRALGREFATTEGIPIPVTKLPANFDASNLHIMSASSSMDTVFMKYNDSVHPTHYILRLTSFAPDDESETLDVIQTMIRMGQRDKVKHLILDMANNGGGIICMSDLLLALLVKDWATLEPGVSPAVPYGIYDFRQSASSNAIRANDYLNRIFTKYQGYMDINTEKVYNNASFYNPISRTRGGYTSQYTQQAYFPAECIGYPGGSFQAIPYYFDHLTVLTDGTCGSACALFASQLQSYNYARVISYGGPLGRKIPLSTASFAGGNVLDYGTVAMYAYYYGNKQPGLPPLMSSSALARFNFNEYYEYNELNIPREFLKRPADIHLDYYATLFNDDLTTALGKSNCAALYSAVLAV